MKTRQILFTAAAVLLAAATPRVELLAQDVQATDVQTEKAEAEKPAVKVNLSGLTVNGKPATPAQKAMAKDMLKQGTQMGKKAAQAAVAAVKHPQQAARLSQELESMGDELERMGDSLEILAEDTTFYYEGEDSDEVVLSGSDLDDFVQGVKDGLGVRNNIPWWKVVLVMFAFIVLLLLIFMFFTSPLWIVGLIIWAVYHSNKRHEETIQKAVENGQPLPPSIFDAPEGTDDVLWHKGVNQLAWGLGLLIAFIVLNSRLLCAIGLILACLGGSKLFIATHQAKKQGGQQPSSADTGTSGVAGQEPPALEPDASGNAPANEYNKSENA